MIRLKMLGALAPLQTARDADGYMEIAANDLTVRELVEMSPAGGTSIKYSALVNRRVAVMEARVKDGDDIVLMPLMAGG